MRSSAGATSGHVGAVQRCATSTLFLSLHLKPGATFTQPLPVAHHAFVVIHRGELDVAGTKVRRCRMACWPARRAATVCGCRRASDGSQSRGPATWANAARAILLAGPPLKEPVAEHGPFAMKTPQEIFVGPCRPPRRPPDPTQPQAPRSGSTNLGGAQRSFRTMPTGAAGLPTRKTV